MIRCELYVLNFPNGKIYIGISKNSAKRLVTHKSRAKVAYSLPIHHAIRKYGEQNVTQQVLCIGERNYIAALEIAFIALHRSTDRRFGYNVTLGGDLSPMMSAEVRARVSATKKIRCATPEFRASISARSKGRIASPEARANMSRAHKGKKLPISQIIKMRGRISHNRGIPATESHRVKCRDAALIVWKRRRSEGRIAVSPEQRARISATLMGHPGAGKGKKRPEIAQLMNGLRWITDGEKNRRVSKDSQLPSGWRYGRAKSIGSTNSALRIGVPQDRVILRRLAP